MNFKELKGERFRRVIAVLAILVTIFYLYWRVTETFNPRYLFFSWVLYGAELFGFLTTLLFYVTVWKPTSRVSPPLLPGRTVDVLIPTKNEPVTILRKTLLACNELKYPHRTMVLDDSASDEVRALCEELDCVYLARTSHEDAKAGNLNFGLEHSTAEFIAVFDADHAPLPRFIDCLIGYFEDDEVAFVQTPQEFYNIDSFQHRVDEQQKYIWGEQYLFFSIIQPGRDHWNAAYFVGSCALLRRHALDDVGGFATKSLTEDLLTSLNIHARGWSSIYHNENLAYGIAPDTIEPFHVQRQRWGIGSWQVFFRANPLLKRGLSLSQRLCYLASLIYPFEGLQKLIFYVTPPIVLLTGILPLRALDISYLLHFVPYYVISLFAFNEMSRGYGGNIMLEQFSMGKYATYLSTAFAFLFSRRQRTFTVTPKGAQRKVPYKFVVPQAFVFALSIGAILFALVQLSLQRRSDDFIIAVNSLWALYNSGLGLAIIQYNQKKRIQRRAHFRIPDAVPVRYECSSNGSADQRLGVVNNLTTAGLSLLALDEIPVGERLALEVTLPTLTLQLQGTAVQGQTAADEELKVSQVGVMFGEVPAARQDQLSRYLHDAAVTKFLRQYRTRYHTFIEKRLAEQRTHRKRAPRVAAYLPVVVHRDDTEVGLGVVKNISATGLLLATQEYIPAGERLSVEISGADRTVVLAGVAVRNLPQPSEDYPEYLVGVQMAEESAPQTDVAVDLCRRVERLLEK